MLSKTQIANLALGFLGSTQTVLDLDTDTTQQAKVIRRHYKIALDEFLEKHPWNFATGYAQLVVTSEDNDSGYKYEYAKPSDALVIRQVAPEDRFVRTYIDQDNTIDFREFLIGGSLRIHTDLKQAWCEYTKELSEDDLVPKYFGKGLAAHLAMEIAPSLITGKYAQIKQLLMKENDDRVGESMAIDLTRSPRRKDPASPFERARNR